MPEDMPDRMPEDMSDRMPEDLPVTKCINVMIEVKNRHLTTVYFFAVEPPISFFWAPDPIKH